MFSELVLTSFFRDCNVGSLYYATTNEACLLNSSGSQIGNELIFTLTFLQTVSQIATTLWLVSRVSSVPLLLSATPQQNEICVKFSVFHAVFWREIL